MTRHVLIFDDDPEAQYRLSRAYLDDKYHNQGTHLRDIPPGAEQDYNWDAPRRNQHSITPNGKKVI